MRVSLADSEILSTRITGMIQLDEKHLRYRELFLVEKICLEGAPNWNFEYRLVGQLENGNLIYIKQIPLPDSHMTSNVRDEYYSITKQEYRELLAKAKKNGLSETAGKYGHPTLEELDSIGQE